MPRRAVIVLGELDPDVVCGATRSILKVRLPLETAGWDLSFWTSVPSATATELSSANVPVDGGAREMRYSLSQLRQPPGVRARLLASRRTLRAFQAHLDRLKPDLVVGNTVGTLPELRVARRLGHRTLLHALEVAPETPRHRLGLRLLSRNSDAIMVPSAATARQFERLGRTVDVVHTGIAVPAEAVAAVDARRTGSEGGRITVGALGTVSTRKGTDLFVAAAEILSRRLAIDFEIAGKPIEGRERASAQALLRRAEGAGVSILGQVNSFETMPRWDILAVASRSDPFPNTILEAMALGVPVIAARVDGIPEQVGTDAGVLIQTDDAEVLAEAVESLAADPARRDQLARAGRARASRHFSIDAQAAATAAVFAAAADGDASDKSVG